MQRHYQIMGWWNVKFNNRNALWKSQWKITFGRNPPWHNVTIIWNDEMAKWNEEKKTHTQNRIEYLFIVFSLTLLFFPLTLAMRKTFTSIFHPFLVWNSSRQRVISIQFIEFKHIEWRNPDEHQLFSSKTKSNHVSDWPKPSFDFVLGWNKKKYTKIR